MCMALKIEDLIPVNSGTKIKQTSNYKYRRRTDQCLWSL